MIEVKNLTKRYGTNTALNNVSFTVEEGTIVGFLGPNGAGKSTTMNIITGYLSATSGSVTVQGKNTLENPNEVKKLPELPPLYMDMTVKEYLNFMYELKGVKLDRKQHIGEICRLTKIDNVYTRLIGNLSKGYKQRVGIAQAILGHPKLILFDEPTTGLDIEERCHFYEIFQQLNGICPVLIASHITEDIVEGCTNTIILKNGIVILQEKTKDIKPSLQEVYLSCMHGTSFI